MALIASLLLKQNDIDIMLYKVMLRDKKNNDI